MPASPGLQLRGGMEWAHNGLGSYWTAMPRIGLQLRHDSGDGVTGTGVEMTAGMNVLSGSERLSLDLNFRTLATHSAEDLSDWGAGLQLRYSPGAGGAGLEFALGPTWGVPTATCWTGTRHLGWTGPTSAGGRFRAAAGA